MTAVAALAAAVRVVAVIPAYNVADHIGSVLSSLPSWFTAAIVVDDASTDGTASVAARFAATDPRIEVVRHVNNRGVGGAMISGFQRALELRADIVVKVDGDGQMPLALAERLVRPLLTGEADYTKGNRFRDLSAIRSMPPIRRFGNVALSFLAKAATGYWDCFDPANGFVAIRGEVLARLPMKDIDPTYFFEISMLSHLYLLGGVVRDVPMPARYEGEPSSLSIPWVVGAFPGRLLASFVRRLVLRNFVYDLRVESLQLVLALPLLIAGALYGGYHWYAYGQRDMPAPTGTIVLSALMIILGAQLLLAAIALDLQSVPTRPINSGRIGQTEPDDD